MDAVPPSEVIPDQHSNGQHASSGYAPSFFPVPEIGEAIPIDLTRAISCEITWLDPTMYPYHSPAQNPTIPYSPASTMPPPPNTSNHHLHLGSVEQEVANSYSQDLKSTSTFATVAPAKVAVRNATKRKQQNKPKKSVSLSRKKSISSRPKRPPPKAKKTSVGPTNRKKTPTKPKIPIAIPNIPPLPESGLAKAPKLIVGNEDNWVTRMEELTQFVQEHGHSSVPCTYAPCPKLGNWCKRQRHQYKLYHSEGENRKRSSMTEERIMALNQVGFCWDRLQRVWEDKLELFRKFVTDNGHGNVTGKDASLYKWVLVSLQPLLNRASSVSNPIDDSNNAL